MAADLPALAERIRSARETAGLSTHEAARRAGISAGYWSSLENLTDDSSPPSVPYLRSVAEVVDVARGELLELAGYSEHAAMERDGVPSPLASRPEAGPALEEAMRELTAEVRQLREALPRSTIGLDRRRLGRG